MLIASIIVIAVLACADAFVNSNLGLRSFNRRSMPSAQNRVLSMAGIFDNVPKVLGGVVAGSKKLCVITGTTSGLG